MLVFRAGKWHDVSLTFSDPMLTQEHLAFAASVVVTERLRGRGETEAILAAEKALLGHLYGSRGKSIAPQSTPKKSAV
jgi:hypothetical protein